ncbi:protein of unknown function [Methylocaldum szegediense]|uniref:Uncharacterized protein n=1 Tax=Methylocaldum szegediense TaxID=73780 RepID=A0ABN8WZ41_9GAMM|nr:protein of unknown function [Methylocaldum szegediense]
MKRDLIKKGLRREDGQKLELVSSLKRDLIKKGLRPQS